MRVYLVRHGEAVDRTGDMPDAARHLTPRGRASLRGTARRLEAEGVRLSHIVCSPLLRAVQTGDLLAEQLGFEGAVVAAPHLADRFDIDALNDLLDTFPGETGIALVGHEPGMGRVLSELLSLPAGYAMSKGAVAAVDLPDTGRRDRGALAWLLDGLRRIGSRSELLA
jgi:phosphohistidine phosphatase